MSTGKRRARILKERAARRHDYESAIVRAKNNPGALVPSKYRMRVEARRRGEPMAARSMPWWGVLHFPMPRPVVEVKP